MCLASGSQLEARSLNFVDAQALDDVFVMLVAMSRAQIHGATGKAVGFLGLQCDKMAPATPITAV